METFLINDLIQFVVVDKKSSKGNNYKAICIQFIDKNGEIVLEKVIDFLSDKQFELVLSLIKK